MAGTITVPPLALWNLGTYDGASIENPESRRPGSNASGINPQCRATSGQDRSTIMGIALNQTEIDEYMLNSPTCILCINREGRPPLPLPMWFGWENNTMFINTAAASKKMAPLRKDPKVAVLVESGSQYYQLKTVLFMGTCAFNDNQEEVNQDAWWKWMRENKPIYNDLLPKKLPPYLEKFYAMERVTLQITPGSTTTWDFEKIAV